MIFNIKFFSLSNIIIKVLFLISTNSIYGLPLERDTNLIKNNNAVISKRDSDNELVTVEDEGKREKRRAGRLREDPDSIFGRPLGVRDEYHRRGYRGRGERHHERRRRHRDGRGHHHGHRGHYHCHHHHHHNRTTTIISKITTMPIVITTKTTTPVTTQTTTSIQKHRKRNLEDYKTLYK